jgi:hypothetical protein
MRGIGILATVAALSATIGACSSTTSPSTGPLNATDAAPSDANVVDCTTDPLVETYAAGMKAQGATGVFQFEIVQVYVENAQGQQVTAPPTLGINRWIVRVLDKSGNPVKGLSFPPETMSPWPAGWPVGVLPYMPRHGHPSSLWPTLTDNMDGTYTVDNLDLYMPGVWQVTFNAKSSSQADSGVFGFCIAG